MTSKKFKPTRNVKIAALALLGVAAFYAAFACFTFKLPDPQDFAQKQDFEQIERMMFAVSAASIDETDAEGRTGLIFFAERGNLDAVKYLVRAGANVHKVARNGCSALSYAAMNGHLSMTEYLLSKNVDLEVQCGIFKETPLLHAVNGRKVGIIRLLIDRGANIDYVGPKQTMTIGMKILKNFPDKDFQKKIAAVSAYPNYKSNNGASLLQTIIDTENKDAIRILLSRGANPNMTVGGDETILYYAASKNNVPAMDLLVKRGAKINTLNHEGWAPITVAAANGHYEAVVYLAGKKARLNPERSFAQPMPVSPLLMASIHGHKDIVSHLVNRGAVLSDQPEIFSTVSSALLLDPSKDDICRVLAEAGQLAE